MNREDYKPFCSVILGFAELKGKQLSAPAIELYWRSMQDWDISDFKRAAEYLIKKCDFMPTPKDFEDLRRADQATAGEAWAEILSCARAGCGFSGDEAAERALRAIGGIDVVMMSDRSKTHFLEKRFAEHFESMRESNEARESVPALSHDVSGLVRKICAGKPTS